jgi:hypothetical protein
VRVSFIASAALAVLVLFSSRSGLAPLREPLDHPDNSLFLIQAQENNRGLEEYQTRGIVLDAQQAAKWAEASYWEQKLAPLFAIEADPRLRADAEERDAVLSAVWQLRPRAINAGSTVIVVIPKRAASRSAAIAYALTFAGKTTTQPKNRLEARFITEGQGAIAAPAPAPSGGLPPQWPPQYRFSGFPNNDIRRYWAENPEERDGVANWITSRGSGPFDQILLAGGRRDSASRSALFHVKGQKDAGGRVADLIVQFLGSALPVSFDPPPDYASRDFADLQIEQLQEAADLKKRDKLGVVNGLAALPASERLSV